MTALAVDLQAIEMAHDRIRPLVHRTPVLTSTTLDGAAGRSLWFKCENLQRVAGSDPDSLPRALEQVVDHRAGHQDQQ